MKNTSQNALTHYSLGLALKEQGKTEEAVQAYQKAIALKPDLAEAYCNLGVIFNDQKKFDAAAEMYKQAIKANPRFVVGRYNLAAFLKERGKLDEAIEHYTAAIALKPDFAIARYNLGNILKQEGKLDEAVVQYTAAIAAKPDYAAARSNLGAIFQEQGRLDEAIMQYSEAIAVKPDFVDAHINLGTARQERDQLDKAVASFRRALDINPLNAEAYNNLGNVLKDLGQIDEAMASFHRALDINPGNNKVRGNLGKAQQDAGLLGDAVASSRRVLEDEPDNSEIQFNLGSALLMSGQFAEGWKKYESRWEGSTPKRTRPATHLPQWTGQNLKPDDGLLIFYEQGWGDKLQFSRYIQLAAERFAKVSVITERPLRALFHRSFPTVEILDDVPADQSAWQWHCALLSLPMAFGTTLENIPGQAPYLIADPAKVAGWKAKIAALDLPARTRKIGVVWKPGKVMKIAKLKALAMQQLAPLLDQTEHTTWFSLQKDTDPDSAPWVASGRLIDWANEFKDFDDTAALMANLDMIISVDTSVAHLAGGLGLPTWLLNRYASDWRWLRGREDSPWYPSMRIFTQEASGDWDGVIRRVMATL